MSETNTASVPTHLGLILDGNRRWATEQGLPTLDGHRKGYDVLKDIAKFAFNKGVKFISAYVFSTENWKRSKEEVSYLMNLLLWVSKHEIKELDKNNIKILFIGERDRLDENVIEALESAEQRTVNNTGGTLLLCFNYGGQQEIAGAVNRLLADDPKITAVTPEMITKYLHHPEVPPVDLIIRTSGEQRLSNFMLWRSAYSEFYFITDKHWPAINTDDIQKAFDNFASRNRRFGGDHTMTSNA